MPAIVLVGHRHDCPLHGQTTVTSGAPFATVNGAAIARVGDQTSCGAIIETGAPHLIIEGSHAARVGDTTSHGGTLVEGDASWLVE